MSKGTFLQQGMLLGIGYIVKVTIKKSLKRVLVITCDTMERGGRSAFLTH